MLEISSSAVRAVIDTSPEMSVPELVMNCLAPLITHSPASSLARVRTLPASEPASGSVSPNAPRILPAVSPGIHSVLLLLRAEQVDRLGAERRVRAQGDGHRGVDPGELLDDERVGQRVRARAAVLLRERDAHQPEVAELAHDLVGERLRAVQLLGDRRHLGRGEVAHRPAQQLVIIRQVEVHASMMASLS